MEHFEELKQTKIFNFASEFECQAMMFCFKTRFKTFDKNEKIISQGDPMEDVILIVNGSAIAENIDNFGDISIIMRIKKGELYGLESAYAGDEYYRDNLIAREKSLVLFLNKHRLVTPCDNRCRRHEIVVRQLMKIVSENNKKLLDKITHMSKKTIRDKLMSYLQARAEKLKSNYFDLPFNKTELANYLSVDRSAMMTELTRMKNDGLIDFENRHFKLEEKFKNKN